MGAVKEVLTEARRIVERGWNQYGNADGEGNFCLRAAVGIASGVLNLVDNEVLYNRTRASDSSAELGAKLAALKLDVDASDVLKAHLPEGYVSIPVFNDDPQTTKGDVLAILDKAISAC